MATFQVLQIQVDRNDEASVNLYRDAIMGWEWLNERTTLDSVRPHYVNVGEVQARDPEHAYELLNLWNDESAVTRRGRMRSLSVGDVLVDQDGNELFCDSFGFRDVGEQK